MCTCEPMAVAVVGGCALGKPLRFEVELGKNTRHLLSVYPSGLCQAGRRGSWSTWLERRPNQAFALALGLLPCQGTFPEKPHSGLCPEAPLRESGMGFCLERDHL